jgi:hypothetical protein
MRFRKLRIAWSAWWGLLTVLLIVMWVRSYYRFDVVRVDPIYKAYSVGGQSGSGCLVIDYVDSYTPAFPQTTFRYQTTNMEQLRADLQQGDAPLPSRVWGTFHARLTPRYGSVTVPYWFLVLAAASCISFPWLPWWSSYSVRALLLATTLAALGLGYVSRLARR